MWRLRKRRNVELEALAATPCRFDLTGHWSAYYAAVNGDVLWGVQLAQHGTAVFGWMQCKLASHAPLTIRGIVLDDRFIANYWRPHVDDMGSGVLDLLLSHNGNALHGDGTWHDAVTGEPESHVWRWEKNSA